MASKEYTDLLKNPEFNIYFGVARMLEILMEEKRTKTSLKRLTDNPAKFWAQTYNTVKDEEKSFINGYGEKLNKKNEHYQIQFENKNWIANDETLRKTIASIYKKELKKIGLSAKKIMKYASDIAGAESQYGHPDWLESHTGALGLMQITTVAAESVTDKVFKTDEDTKKEEWDNNKIMGEDVAEAMGLSYKQLHSIVRGKEAVEPIIEESKAGAAVPDATLVTQRSAGTGAPVADPIQTSDEVVDENQIYGQLEDAFRISVEEVAKTESTLDPARSLAGGGKQEIGQIIADQIRKKEEEDAVSLAKESEAGVPVGDPTQETILKKVKDIEDGMEFHSYITNEEKMGIENPNNILGGEVADWEKQQYVPFPNNSMKNLEKDDPFGIFTMRKTGEWPEYMQDKSNGLPKHHVPYSDDELIDIIRNRKWVGKQTAKK